MMHNGLAALTLKDNKMSQNHLFSTEHNQDYNRDRAM